jgi:hypothetical protein
MCTTACAFGCEATTGLCADLVPANHAGSHLAATDTFTCTGAQSVSLPAITSPANGTVAVDTTAQTITVNGTVVTGVLWGTPYKPTGSGTTAVVAHVKSVALGNGSMVNVTGTPSSCSSTRA